MARRNNRRGRDGRSITRRSLPRSSAPAPRINWDSFDEAWLSAIERRPGSFEIDLDKVEDRRRWSPERVNRWSPYKHLRPLTVHGNRPRIVVVPEKHRLAKYQTYKGRYYRSNLPRTVGFSLPWNVVICVRRKVRREVIFAAGKSGRNGKKPYRRTEYSEVRC